MRYLSHPFPRREDYKSDWDFYKAQIDYYAEQEENTLINNEMTRENIIETMTKRPVSREELRLWLGCSDRVARQWIQDLRVDYPIISTSNQKGYKIAMTSDDLDLVKDSLKNQRAKAISIFAGGKKLKEFLAKYGAKDDGQLSLEF